jgi:hypothetical protein
VFIHLHDQFEPFAPSGSFRYCQASCNMTVNGSTDRCYFAMIQEPSLRYTSRNANGTRMTFNSFSFLVSDLKSKITLTVLYILTLIFDCLCGLVVRVPGYGSRGLGWMPGATRFSDKWWIWNGAYSVLWVQLRSYLKEKVGVPVQKTENTAVGIRHAHHVAPFIRKSWH